ncbi:MAG TPA: hypothetical protein VHJ19_01490, partial [Gammaproteobacteria bacterium]|nr:hypothetical protein [Gammaproteobacteria bacterium]
MTIARLIGRLNAALTPDMMVVCDIGDCLVAAVELRVHAPSFWPLHFIRPWVLPSPRHLVRRLRSPIGVRSCWSA